MTDKSIAIELWNSPEHFVRFASDRTSTVEGICRLLNEYYKLQEDYGKKIRKLAASYVKGQGDDESGLQAAHTKVAQMILEMGTVLEKDAKDITSQVLQPLKTVCTNHKKEIDTQNANIAKVYSSLDNNRKMLDVSWTKYSSAYKEKQAAAERYDRAENDMQLTGHEKSKIKQIANQKAEEYETAMSRYAGDLEKYNANKNQCYNKQMVAALEELDINFRNSTLRTQELLLQMTDMKQSTFVKMQEYNSSTGAVFSAIDPAKDVSAMLAKSVGNKLPPDNLPFIRLDVVPPQMLYGHPSLLGAHMLGIDSSQPCAQLPPIGNSGASGASRRGESVLPRSPFICDISVKPINEEDMVITQLADRMQSMKELLKQAMDERDALARMVGVYENNTALGDSLTVKPKQEALIRRVQSIQLCIARLNDLYLKHGGDEGLAQAKMASNRQRQTWEAPAKVAQPPALSGNSTSFDSDNSFDSDIDDPPGPVLPVPSVRPTSTKYIGIATAKYAYSGNGPDYLAAREGERFHIVELDTKNIGWTAVVSDDGSRKGFVPTGFIDVTLF